MDSWLVLGPTALAAAGLLVLAGVPKVADPGDLVRALRSTGLRVHPLLVRGFALVEVAAGLRAEGRAVTAVTSDRELTGRLERSGASVRSVSWLRDLL